MGEPAPEIERPAIVEVGIEFSPFEFDNQLPEINTEEPGAFFRKKFVIIIRGIDSTSLEFDKNPDPRTLGNTDVVIISEQGVIFAQRGKMTAQELASQNLYEVYIDFDSARTQKSLDWKISFPEFNFEAKRKSSGTDISPLEFLVYNQSGREVAIFVPRNLELLKKCVYSLKLQKYCLITEELKWLILAKFN